jgi:uncharacterized protein (TIGR02300 family)
VSNIKERDVVKPEWGTKRTCPKCGERFYDLGIADPCVCIACGVDFKPEPVLKTKQPIVAVVKKEEGDEDDEDDIDLDAEGDNAVSLDDSDDTEVAAMVDTKLSTDESA